VTKQLYHFRARPSGEGERVYESVWLGVNFLDLGNLYTATKENPVSKELPFAKDWDYARKLQSRDDPI